MKLTYMSCQPATKYYAWQAEVMINNFIDKGVSGNDIEIVCSYKDDIDEHWLKLQAGYPFVRMFFYKSDYEYEVYPPGIQANTLKKHFRRFPELEDQAVFFHDVDFLFTDKFDFTKFLRDENWYFSDTDSYLGADYLESKGFIKSGEEGALSLLDGMAKEIGMCPCKVRANRGNSGGAQKLIKNVNAEYWEEVEENTIAIHKWLIENKDKYGDKEKNDIQVWTASMWGELWTAWMNDHNVVTVKDFDFAWATDPIQRWTQVKFFHNAGVTDDKNGMFFKSKFINDLPYGSSEDVKDNKCSYLYYQQVLKTGEKSKIV